MGIILYSIEEMVVMSLMYSRIKKERFTVPVFNHLLLSEVFKVSLEKEMSLFDRNNIVELVGIAVDRCKERHPDMNFEKCAKELRGFLSAFNYRKAIREAKSELDTARRKKINVITYLDENYPESLKNLEIPPFVLYIIGNLPSKEVLDKSLSIIGARNLERKHGAKIAHEIGEILLDRGWYNVGGLTAGCGEYGHRASIGATGAILGQGLATPIFPLENKELAKEIIENNGFIMSELPPSIKLNPVGVVARDRLQSGLTQGIIVVETSQSSGIMRAVKYALNQEKEVIVVDMKKYEDEIENKKDIMGNIALLDSQNHLSTNVEISVEEKSKIIGISEKEDLLSLLEELERENTLEREIA